MSLKINKVYYLNETESQRGKGGLKSGQLEGYYHSQNTKNKFQRKKIWKFEN